MSLLEATPLVIRRSVLSACVLAWLLAASGCATIREEDCPKVDWYKLGAQDGAEGRAESRLHEHRRACRDVGVQPDERAYLAGRNEGLRSYCNLATALREGSAGRSYQGVCVGPIDGPFRDVNSAAYAVHEARQRVRQLESSISSRERDLRKDGLSDRDRDRIRSDIRDMDRRRYSARDDVYRYERELDDVRRRYRL